MKILLVNFLILTTMACFGQIGNGSFETVTCNNLCVPNVIDQIYRGCVLPWASSHGAPNAYDDIGCPTLSGSSQDGKNQVIMSQDGIFQSYPFEKCKEYKVSFWARNFRSGNLEKENKISIAGANNLLNMSNATTPYDPSFAFVVHEKFIVQSINGLSEWKYFEFIIQPTFDWTQFWIYAGDEPVPNTSQSRFDNNRIHIDNISLEPVQCNNSLGITCDASFSKQEFPNGTGTYLRLTALNGSTSPLFGNRPTWRITNITTGQQYVIANKSQIYISFGALCAPNFACDLSLPFGQYEICLTLGKSGGEYFTCYDEKCATFNFKEKQKEKGQYELIQTEELKDEGVHIYPNPAQSHFQLDFGNDVNVRHIRLVDQVGHVVLEEKNFTSGQRIATQSLASGMYLIQINNETTGIQTTKKVVIN